MPKKVKLTNILSKFYGMEGMLIKIEKDRIYSHCVKVKGKRIYVTALEIGRR
ncbi:MAG: hypothetical protein ABFC84_16860 [Veillonellales bacterium]